MHEKRYWLFSGKDSLCLLFILIVSLGYAGKLILSPDDVIPYGIDFDTNLAPTYLLNGGLSLWNDLLGTGFPAYASPLSNIFYPLATPFLVAFGIPLGLKLVVFTHILLSGVGFYFFSRNLTVNYFARTYGSTVYMLSGSLAARVYAGHIETLMAFPWVPITLYFIYNATRRRRREDFLLSGASAAMFIFTGGIYLALFFSFLFFSFFFVRIAITKNRKNTGIALKIVAIALLISSIKLVPMLNLQRYQVRIIEIAGLENVVYAFSRFYGQYTELSGGWWESYSYIGFLPFLLFLVGLAFHRSREKYYLIVSMMLGLVWVQSNFPWLAVWLHSLPVFDNFRVPTRAYLLLAFCMISLSTLGFDAITGYVKKRTTKDGLFICSAILLLIAPLGAYLRNGEILSNEYYYDSSIYEDIKSRIRPFWLSSAGEPAVLIVEDPIGYTRKHLFLKHGLNYFDANYAYNFKSLRRYMSLGNNVYSIPDFSIENTNAKRKNMFEVLRYTNALPFAFVVRDGRMVRGNAKIVDYRPDNIGITVKNALPGDLLVLKVSYYTGWIAEPEGSGTGKANNYRGLVSYKVAKPEGNLKIRFRYVPVDLYAGLSISLVSMLIFVLLRGRFRKSAKSQLNSSRRFQKRRGARSRPSVLV